MEGSWKSREEKQFPTAKVDIRTAKEDVDMESEDEF